jgi:hypothetical protein
VKGREGEKRREKEEVIKGKRGEEREKGKE